MNDEQLIEFVRQYEELYDLSNSKYMDIAAKNEIWARIGAEMNIDGTLCKNRWHNIRDTYRKSLKRCATKSGQGAKNVKVYKYADQLGFLKKYLEERETVSNICFPEESQDISDAQFSQHVETEEGPLQEEHVMNTPQPSAVKSVHSKKSVASKKVYPQESASSKLMEYLIAKNDVPTTQQHPVEVFLSAMTPSLKKLSPYNWHLAKSEIFSTVQKYELKALMSQQNYVTHDDSSSFTPSSNGKSDNASVSLLGDGASASSDSSGLRNYFGEFQ